jgi:hypothetical protein
MMMNAQSRLPQNGELAEWLTRTLRQLKQGELPPESWERGISPFEDSAAQRRISRLIVEIAERRKVEEEAAERLRDTRH